MDTSFTRTDTTVRYELTTHNENAPLPNLLKICKASYNELLQRFISWDTREVLGIEKMLRTYFGASYLGYAFGTSLYSSEECLYSNKTYSIPVYVYLKDAINSSSIYRHYIGQIPILTKNGSFIINGIESTIVNQLIRDCGLYVNKTSSPLIRASIKVRGTKGKAIQIDIFQNSFIGRRLNTASIKRRKEYTYSHQDVHLLIDDSVLSFSELGDMFTFTVIKYKYSDRSWYPVFNWRVVYTHRYLGDDHKNIFNLSSAYGSFLDNINICDVFSTEIDCLFIPNMTKHLCSKNYVLLDLYNSDGYSIFQDEYVQKYPKQVVIFLLKIIGKSTAHIYKNTRLMRLLEDIVSTYNLNVHFIDLVTKSKYSQVSVMHLINTKKTKIRDRLNNTDGLHTLNKLNLLRDLDFSDVGKKKLQCRLGISEYEPSGKIFSGILRSLIQIDKGLVCKDLFEEQDLYNRKFISVGEQFHTCLSSFFEQSTQRMSTVYRTTTQDLLLKKIDSCRYIFQSFIKFLSRSSLYQYTEQANPLAYITHSRKISIMGPGGLKADNVSLEMRDVHISSYGRICPIETPEGKSVGVVTSLCVYARVNKQDQLESPYLLVRDGCVTNIIHYLSPIEEKILHIAISTENIDKDHSFVNENNVYCRYGNRAVITSSKNINYIELSSKQITSLSSSMIPFLEHNDANRALMGSNMQRQAVPLDHIETPIIGTHMEMVTSRDTESSTVNNRANLVYQESRVIIDLKHSNCTSVKNISNLLYRETCSLTSQDIVRYKNTNQKTTFTQILHSTPLHTSINGFGILNNNTSLGNNILISYMSMNGHTFEDSIVISERLLQCSYLQSTHLEIYRGMELYESDAQEIISRLPTARNVDNDGVVEVGTYLYKDDIVICKERRLLMGNHRNKLMVSDKSVRYKSKKHGYVVQRIKFFEDTYSEDSYTDRNPWDSTTTSVYSYIAKNTISRKCFLHYLCFSDNILIKNGYCIHTTDLSSRIGKQFWWSFLRIYSIYVSTAINTDSSRKILIVYTISMLIQKYKTLLCELSNDKLHIIKELRRIPLFSFNHINVRAKYRKRLVRKNTTFLKTGINRRYGIGQDFVTREATVFLEKILPFLILYSTVHSLQYGLTPNTTLVHDLAQINRLSLKNFILKMVKVVIATKHSVQVGDKLTGRYGNKGVVSRVMLMEDMPYIKDGTPVDIILNPLGISSRMNIGQLFETHIGFVSAEISKYMQHLALRKGNFLQTNLRAFLSMLYKNKKDLILIQNMDIECVYYLYVSITHSLLFTTPVFDSIKNTEIDMLIRQYRLNSNGKITLYDGLTGSPLDNKVTVGFLHILKLNHLVDHKIHGRSTGPYNVVTQQASKGKSKNGGQRLGEMEVWSLQAYGAAFTLQEMLTFKSDSTVARTNFLQQFIKGKSYKIDVPRTFKLLRDELRVLGMELSFIVKRYRNH